MSWIVMEYTKPDGKEKESPENYCAIRILFVLKVIKTNINMYI